MTKHVFWYHSMDLEIVKVLFVGLVFCSVIVKVSVLLFKMQHQSLTWFSVSFTKSTFVYTEMVFTLHNFFRQKSDWKHIKIQNTNTTFKGFVYFWFTNKGTQYFCLCLIKAHGFSICFQTFVPTAEKDITGKHVFFLVPNLNTNYC